jgi:hypothetical protein
VEAGDTPASFDFDLESLDARGTVEERRFSAAYSRKIGPG